VTLAERARAVRTREDLVAFIEALSGDYTDNSSTWSNKDLGAFLGAMSAWAEDMEGYYANSGEDVALRSPWGVLADLLMAARVYE
jgi:hypothetical protein